VTYALATRRDLLERMLEAVESGCTVRQFARDVNVSHGSLYVWADEEGEEFSRRFARARRVGNDAIAQDCLNIADDRESDPDPASRRVRVWTRLQLLARWDPRYRERQEIEHSGKLTLEALVAASLPPKVETVEVRELPDSDADADDLSDG